MKATPGTLASRRMVTSKIVSKKAEFIRHINALNTSFFDWFAMQYKGDQCADMSLGVQDYIDYVNQLQDRYSFVSGGHVTLPCLPSRYLMISALLQLQNMY